MKFERTPKVYALLLATVLGTSACTSNSIPTKPTSVECSPSTSGVLEDMQLTPGFKVDPYNPNHTSVFNIGNCARIVDSKTNAAIGAIANQEQFFVTCLNVAVTPESLRVKTIDTIGNVELSEELELRIRGEGQQPFSLPIMVCPPDYTSSGTRGSTHKL